MEQKPIFQAEGGWAMAVTLCVMAVSLAACVVGSLWALAR